MSSFVFPRGSVDGSYTNAAEIADRQRSFASWAQGLSRSVGTTTNPVPQPGAAKQSFDAMHLDGAGLWLLHQRFNGLLGATEAEPAVGDGWAVAAHFVDLDIADHLRGWGPVVIPAADLNAPLEPHQWANETAQAKQLAQKYSPTRVAQVLFNYWE